MQNKMVCIGEISNDYEADVLASLFQGHDIPCVIQGRNHRRMMGMLGTQFIRMRLLVAEDNEVLATELLNQYYTNLEDESIEYEEIEGLRFSRKSQKMGLTLLLSLFLGFGTASLVAGLHKIAVLWAILHVSCYIIDPITLSTIFDQPAASIIFLKLVIPICDLLCAWCYILWLPSTHFNHSPSNSNQDT
jgi:hypothetical protein